MQIKLLLSFLCCLSQRANIDSAPHSAYTIEVYFCVIEYSIAVDLIWMTARVCPPPEYGTNTHMRTSWHSNDAKV